MGKRKDPKQLYKLLIYVLGHRPDEFGLVPDENGFVRKKDLIRSIGEEPGWGYVRKSHLNEVFLLYRDHPFVIDAVGIKVSDPAESARAVPADDMPKLLYHCIRRKAYPVVSRRGVVPMGQHHVFLATTEAMALRMGKRRDPKPVLLTVHTRHAVDAGVGFRRQGELLYVVNHVPVGCFAGPPLPREEAKETPKTHEKTGDDRQMEPGTFTLDMERSQDLHRRAIKRKGIKKDIAWKKEARKERRKRR